jgi:hypothetical protein
MAMSPAARPAPVRRWPAALAWTLAGLAVLALPPAIWLARLLEAAGLPDEDVPAGAAAAVTLAIVSAAAVGALLAGRRPRHPVGWLLIGVGLGLAANILLESYVKYGLLVRPGSLPAARYLVGFSVLGLTLVWLTCAGFVLLLTPTGSLPSPRWRWWARVAVAGLLVAVVAGAVQPDPLKPDYHGNPLAVPALYRLLVVPGIAGIVVVVASLLVGAGSLVGRFRRASGVERQQLRWLALAAGCASVLLLAALVAGYLGKDTVVLACLTLSVALLPLATGAAILRYRLYDLDRIISRTLAYGLLTLTLGLGYTALVLGLGQLLGRDTPLVIAAATLAVAAAFQPARRRVQAAVDRRFNRRRYDAAHTIQAFSARLRQQVDLDTLTAELLAVVEQTMQPTRVSLWLRPTQEAAGQAGDGVGVRRASRAATKAAPSRATPSR